MNKIDQLNNLRQELAIKISKKNSSCSDEELCNDKGYITLLREYNKVMDDIVSLVPGIKDMTIKSLIQESHKDALEHGFWDNYNRQCMQKGNTPEEQYDIQSILTAFKSQYLFEIASELSEALDALKKNDQDNFKEELADAFIYLADFCGGINVDIVSEIKKKLKENADRPFLHGKIF